MAEINLNIVASSAEDLHQTLAALASLGDGTVNVSVGGHTHASDDDYQRVELPANPSVLEGAPEGDGKVRGSNAEALVKLLSETQDQRETAEWQAQFERLPKKDQATVIGSFGDAAPATEVNGVIVYGLEGASSTVADLDAAAGALEAMLEKCSTQEQMAVLAKSNMTLVNETMTGETQTRVKEAFSVAYDAAATDLDTKPKDAPSDNPTTPAAENLTIDALRALIAAVCKDHGMPVGKDIITGVGGAEKLSDVPADRYPAMAAACASPTDQSKWDLAL